MKLLILLLLAGTALAQQTVYSEGGAWLPNDNQHPKGTWLFDGPGTVTFNKPIISSGANTWTGVQTFTNPASNQQLKSASNDLIQYVSNNGNDSNDGLSWGTAKLTVAAACTALGSNAACTTTHLGVVYTAPGFTGSVPNASSSNHGPLIVSFGGGGASGGSTIGNRELDILGDFRIWQNFGDFELVPSNQANGSNSISGAPMWYVTTCWNGSSAVEQDIEAQVTTPAGTNQNTTLAWTDPFPACTGHKTIFDLSGLSLTQVSHLGQGSNHDLAGTCTAATATTCTVTFTAAYTSAPVCTATDATNIVALKVTPSTTQLVITTAASSSDTFDYHCIGNPN